MSGSTSLVLRAAAVACFGVALAGCSTSVSPSAPPTTAVATRPAATAPALTPTSAPVAPTVSATASGGSPSPTPRVSASASISVSVPAAPPAGGGPDGCATRDLQVKAGTAQGAAGSLYQNIDFTNLSGTPCTLYGYPGVSLAAGLPVTQVGAAASRSSAAPAKVVTLGAGQTANALLRITQAVNYPATACKPKATTWLQVYPPNQTTPVYLQYTSTGCTSAAVILLTIGVVQPGAGS